MGHVLIILATLLAIYLLLLFLKNLIVVLVTAVALYFVLSWIFSSVNDEGNGR